MRQEELRGPLGNHKGADRKKTRYKQALHTYPGDAIHFKFQFVKLEAVEASIRSLLPNNVTVETDKLN